MIVLGVDPGTLITGYGVVEADNGRMRMLACDAIRNDIGRSMPHRLKLIYEILTRIIETHKPDACAIESAFYGKNAQSALKLGQARGVSLLAAVVNAIPTAEYSPREVKKAVVGRGNAEKHQVQYMVKALLQLKDVHRYYDVTDALAVAICHIQRQHSTHSTYHTWKSYLAAHPEIVSPQRLKRMGAK
jgi:crossover junction endodeoxyribonuclease RuvC